MGGEARGWRHRAGLAPWPAARRASGSLAACAQISARKSRRTYLGRLPTERVIQEAARATIRGSVASVQRSRLRAISEFPADPGLLLFCGLGAPSAKEYDMAAQIPIGGIHHLRLTVTDLDRSRAFYTGLLGFDVAAESPPADDPAAAAAYQVLFGGIVMIRGSLLMGLRPVAPAGDRFDDDRVGLDHLSFGVPARADLDQAVSLFDENGVPHGEITALPSFGIYVLPFRDPDNVQLELTAPID
jgi:glyoxylase I family protein